MSDARGFWFDFDGTQRKLLKDKKNSFIQWIFLKQEKNLL